MEALVGYGASSDSEEDSSSSLTEKENKVTAGGERKIRNFLLESGSESSSESEPEEEQEEPTEADCPASTDSSSEALLPPPFSTSSHRLPPPPLGRSGSGGLPAGSSVFANPFKERAEERLNVLQKHVPLTQQALPSQIGGKRMCVAYRRDGRCRFGIRCKFAHDSDLQSSAGFPTEPDPSNNGAVDQSEPAPGSSHTLDSRASGLEEGKEEEEEEEEEGRKRKKHRVGLSNTLIPPKRALKQYSMQKDRGSRS